MRIYFFIVSVIIVLFSCTDDDLETMDAAKIQALDGTQGAESSSCLIWLDSSGEEMQKIVKQLQQVNKYNTVLSYNSLPGPNKKSSLIALAKDSLTDLTVVGNVNDFIAGAYSYDMIQDIRHSRKGVILIAKGDNSEKQKDEMLKLFGLYVSNGYYKVSFPREQRYAFYDINDPDAIKKLCGTDGLNPQTRASGSSGPTDDPSDPKVTDRAMAAMKRIYISNRYYVYTNDYKYPMTGYEPLHPYSAEKSDFVSRNDKMYDASVDREWTIDAYNLRIYAPTNGDNMLAVYNSGGNGFSNNLDHSTVMLANPPKNEVWALIWGLRNKAYTQLKISDDRQEMLNMKLIDFAPGLPELETGITHSQVRDIGFKLGVSPELEGSYRWGKSITYQLAEMTRRVSHNIQDKNMTFGWEWYPETLFQGSKAIKEDGMIDGAAMISPAWYEVLYNNVGTSPGTDNVFCDYNNDLQFNQNMLNYLQECAVTAKTNGASAGLVSIDITDGILLQRGGAWFNSWGSPSLHQLPSDSGVASDATVDIHKTTTVWIDYNNW